MMIFKTITTASLIFGTFSSRCAAFVPSTLKYDAMRASTLLQNQPVSLIRLAYMDKDGEANDSISKALSARTSVHQFLTQRSVQTFLFLLRECHDPHTARWIEGFTEAKNLLSYHGTGAFSSERFPGWDSFFMEMMAQPADAVLLEIEKDLSGMSANNPFREKEVVRRTIEIDIDPPSLVGRILSVRESLSREWNQDLELVIAANDKIIASYNEKVAGSRGTKERLEDGDEKDVGLPTKNPSEGTSSGDTSSRATERHVEKYHAFERLEIWLLNNHPSMNDPESTPLRASNFDLLFLLSTQESIHRLLKKYMTGGEEKAASFRWLLEHYSANVGKYFDGSQRYGRADDYLDDFLCTPPSLKTTEDGRVDLIDPLSMAEEIIEIRGEVAGEWKGMMSLVPESQSDIRKDVFVCQMTKWGQPIEPEPTNVKEAVIVEGMNDFQ